ncbi:MAG: ABC transporter ATP-binding protein [Propionibacteriaceae bacterium]|jgi:iron complex transport system ATP-binding protein|nr:ABC transporter ATP-binding protein [Propionibacteriaceae bacterium]
MTELLRAQDLTVRYGELTIVDQVDFSLAAGDWLMVVGPNGAGKSTIVSAISGGVPHGGRVELLGRPLRSYKPSALARVMGVLDQRHGVGYAFTVEEVVRLGRYCHRRGVFAGSTSEDEAAIERAVAMTGLEPVWRQSVLTLSGGELQRTFLAQLFAQEPQVLILDEPTNHLDLAYQEQVFDLISLWLGEPGRAVLSVVHDLSLARAYGSSALLLDRGRLVDAGSVTDTLSRANLSQVYQMDVYAWMERMLTQWQQATVS